MRRRKSWFWIFLLLIVLGLFSLGKPLLTAIGEFPVKETATLKKGDGAVVLYTGAGYTERLIEAAAVYKKGLVGKVVIDGDRKSEILRNLETKGYRERCHWSVNPIGVLNFFGVPERDVIVIDAPDVYDTVSEALIVGRFLHKFKLKKLIVTTSKFHTRRAGYIWRRLYKNEFDIQVVAAKEDPFRPEAWWRDRRQVKQIMAEYGAWVYYLLKDWQREGRDE